MNNSNRNTFNSRKSINSANRISLNLVDEFINIKSDDEIVCKSKERMKN